MPRLTPLIVVKGGVAVVALTLLYLFITSDSNKENHIGWTDDNNPNGKKEQCTDKPDYGGKVNTAYKALHHTVASDVCPAATLFYSATSDIQMLEAYDVIPFDNPNGGVWTQGFDITYDKKAIQKEKQLQVIVVPHSHHDPGWLHTFEEYQGPVFYILNCMLDYLTKHPDMKFIYAEMSFFESWWSHLSDSNREAVKKLLNNGQLEIVTGAWVMTDEANSHYYATIMEMIEGHEFLVNQLDTRPTNHWSIDPFGLSPTLSYIVKAANFSHMTIQRVHYSVKKYLAKQKNLEFVWRQMWAGDNKKTDIFTHLFPFLNYNIVYTCGPDPSVCRKFDFRDASKGYDYPWISGARTITKKNIAWKSKQLADQYRKKAQLYKSNVLLVPLGDDFRYWGDEFKKQHVNYAKLFNAINADSSLNMHVQFGTLKDYFDLLDKQSAEEPDELKFPTLSGDFFTYADRDDHYWSGYFTSRPFYKHMDRSLGHYLRSADLAFSLANMKSNNSNAFNGIYYYDMLIEARRALSLFQHHDGVTGTAKARVVQDYGKKMFKALFSCQHFIARAAKYLFNLPDDMHLIAAEKYSENSLPISNKANDKSTIIIQNSMAYDREEVVCVRVNTIHARVKKPDSNDKIVQQIEPVLVTDANGLFLRSEKFNLCFLSSVPPFGWTRYEIFETQNNANDVATLETSIKLNSYSFKATLTSRKSIELSNDHITARFDPHSGFLSSVKTDNVNVNVSMSFVHYGARPHKYYWDFGGDHRSGAYLFLPDGEAKSLSTESNTFVVISGPLRKRIIIRGSDEIKLLQTVSLDFNAAHLDIRNLVDIRSQGNFEAAMRIKTDLTENEQFYTELNGYQFIRRKRFPKLPLQAQFYPMPGAAFIEDTSRRVTLLGRQALGVASLRPGWIEVMLDRRLDQDDWRGLSEAVHDNLQTESNFRLVFEKVDTPFPDAELTTGYHSLSTSILSAQLHYPAVVLIGEPLNHDVSKKIPLTIKGLSSPLPCDVHPVALRTLSQATNYTNNERHTMPDNSMALVLHRYGVECRIQTKLPITCSSLSINNTINVNKLFNNANTKIQSTSLTLLYTNNKTNITDLTILPMELKTVKILF